LCLFRFLRLLFSGQQALVIENLALRRQLAAYKRRCKRPLLNEWDRLFWIGLSRVWTGWRGALVFVQPDTVVRWQRDRFRRFWARLSRVDGRRAGRPALAPEVRRLIVQIAKAKRNRHKMKVGIDPTILAPTRPPIRSGPGFGELQSPNTGALPGTELKKRVCVGAGTFTSSPPRASFARDRLRSVQAGPALSAAVFGQMETRGETNGGV
jgi:hypothetical protein